MREILSNASVGLHKKPNLKKLEQKGFISSTEKKLMNEFEHLGFEVDRQVCFPYLEDGITKHYYIDAVIGHPQNINLCVGVEFDHPKYHNEKKDKIRDNILQKYGLEIIRIRWTFPFLPYTAWQIAVEELAIHYDKIITRKLATKIKIFKLKESINKKRPTRKAVSLNLVNN